MEMQQSGDQKETRKEDVSILHDMLKKLKGHKVPKTGSKGQKQLKINRSYFIITISLEYRGCFPLFQFHGSQSFSIS